LFSSPDVIVYLYYNQTIYTINSTTLIPDNINGTQNFYAYSNATVSSQSARFLAAATNYPTLIMTGTTTAGASFLSLVSAVVSFVFMMGLMF